MSKWESEKEELERLINVEKVSYEEIGRRYGCSGANIKKVAKLIGIELPQRRKINSCETFDRSSRKIIRRCPNCEKEVKYPNKYCDIKCQKEYEHKQKYLLLVEGHPSVMRANYSPKIFKDDIIKEQGGVCDICKCKPEHNGKPLVFIIDHIDGNAANNKRDNLRCICPNCDSQLDTYKSKNKNGARSYYRYHKFDEETKIGK
jgi:hypothetical protein